MQFAKYVSAGIEAGRRFVKVLRLGLADVQTPREAMPFGVDSCPVGKDFVAIMADSAQKGKPVIVGYINRNQIATEGQFRIYSLKSDGTISQYILLKEDETIEFGGTGDFLVRFNPLKTGLDNQATAINTELAKIQTAIAALGGTYARVNVSVNIDGAKIEEFETL